MNTPVWQEFQVPILIQEFRRSHQFASSAGMLIWIYEWALYSYCHLTHPDSA